MSIFNHYYYFLENLSGDACKILTTRSLKNSVPALAFIHSHASISGATINPARFVNVFPLPAGSNAAPSFNCVNMLIINTMHWVVCIMSRTCRLCVIDSAEFNFIDAQNLIASMSIFFGFGFRFGFRFIASGLILLIAFSGMAMTCETSLVCSCSTNEIQYFLTHHSAILQGAT